MYVKIDPDPSKNATLLYCNNSIEAQIDQKDLNMNFFRILKHFSDISDVRQ